MYRFYLILACLLLYPVNTHAQQYWEEMTTDVRISVLAKDALFVGAEIGGAHVKIIEKRTGDILAEGITFGDAGMEELIMGANRSRDTVIVNKTSASFDFSLAIFEPTPVTISATGPLAQPQSQFTVSQDYILLPGKNYTSGNGIILELPGISVDILAPAAHQKFPFNSGEPVTFLANILKLSGNNIEKDSFWPPDRYQVQAFIYRNQAFVGIIPMQYAGKSQFIGKADVSGPGAYRIMVSAFDPKTKESGMDVTTMIIEPPETE